MQPNELDPALGAEVLFRKPLFSAESIIQPPVLQRPLLSTTSFSAFFSSNHHHCPTFFTPFPPQPHSKTAAKLVHNPANYFHRRDIIPPIILNTVSSRPRPHIWRGFSIGHRPDNSWDLADIRHRWALPLRNETLQQTAELKFDPLSSDDSSAAQKSQNTPELFYANYR